MDKSIYNLLDLLKKEKNLYQQLLKLAEAKQEAIAAVDSNAIQEMEDKEAALKLSISSLAAKREDYSHGLAKLLGQNPEGFNLSSLSNIVGVSGSAAIINLQKEFALVLNQLAVKTEANQKLMSSQLEYVQFMLNVMSQEEQINNTYCGKGHANFDDENRINIFDCQI